MSSDLFHVKEWVIQVRVELVSKLKMSLQRDFSSSDQLSKILEYAKKETGIQDLFLCHDKKQVSGNKSIGSFCKDPSCCLTAIDPDDEEGMQQYFGVDKSAKEAVTDIFDDDQSSDEGLMTDLFGE